MCDLTCKQIEIDEILGFVGAKQKNARRAGVYGDVAVEKTVVTGTPDVSLISTSHVEKQNHTLRMHCRRLTRLTNAFSKKIENFQAAVALNFAYYITTLKRMGL